MNVACLGKPDMLVKDPPGFRRSANIKNMNKHCAVFLTLLICHCQLTKIMRQAAASEANKASKSQV